jgi:hypothetical protein
LLGRNCQREDFLLRQVMNQRYELYFFPTAGPGAGDGVAATRTTVPVVRESDGLTITLSDSVTPPRISD